MSHPFDFASQSWLGDLTLKREGKGIGDASTGALGVTKRMMLQLEKLRCIYNM